MYFGFTIVQNLSQYLYAPISTYIDIINMITFADSDKIYKIVDIKDIIHTKIKL